MGSILAILLLLFISFLFFGIYQKLPNTVGFVFGIVQMGLYVFYKNAKKVLEEPKLQQLPEHIIDVVKLSTIVCPELNSVVILANAIGNDQANGDQIEKEKPEETKKDMDDSVNV